MPGIGQNILSFFLSRHIYKLANVNDVSFIYYKIVKKDDPETAIYGTYFNIFASSETTQSSLLIVSSVTSAKS